MDLFLFAIGSLVTVCAVLGAVLAVGRQEEEEIERRESRP